MKRKFLIVVLTLVCAVCLALGISACSASDGTDSTTVMEEGVVYFTDFSIKYTSAEDSPNGDINKSTLTDEINGSVQSYYLVMNFNMQLVSNTNGLEYITVKFVVLDADVVETIIDYADTSNVSAITSDGQTTITATYSLPDKANSVKNINLVLELKPKTTGATDIYYYFSSNTKEISGYTDEDITYNYTSDNISTSKTSLEYTLNDDGQSYSVTGIGTKRGDVKVKEIYNGLPVTAIGKNAFYRCTKLTSITIGSGVTSIGYEAFKDCTSLTSITIGSGVTSIGSDAFYNTAYYNDINNWEDNVLYIGNYLIKADTSISGSYTIKDGTTFIATSAFNSCTALESITIPNSVTSIGVYAFRECTALESITIPNSVTSIGSDAFYECTKLTSITIPNSVTSIGDYAFEYCTALENVTIGSGVTSIGYRVFYNCTALESITIPDSVTSIGERAFYACTALESVTIPDSVTSIGDKAFYNTAYYNDTNNWENNVLYMGNYLIAADTSISGSYTIKGGTTFIATSAFYNCTKLTSVTIPNSVSSIGSSAFSGCTSLKSTTIPDGVTFIGDETFRDCTALTSITIPDSVTSIGGSTFYGCSSLTSIIIPDSVTSIGKWAFRNCTSLTSVTIGNGVTSIGASAFDNTAYYNDTNNWESDSLYIGNYLIKAGVGFFSSTFFTGSYTIKDGTTIIADRAFYGCGDALTSITIPNSVTSIGNYAFESTALKSITIPNSVTSIGESAFYDCTELTNVTFENTSGWYVTQTEGAESGTEITSYALSSASTAATYLSGTYLYYYWYRSES